jgi:hypothetical protein
MMDCFGDTGLRSCSQGVRAFLFDGLVMVCA